MQIHRPAIADRKVRFAVIGCGRIAQNHFEAIKQHSSRAELSAICDIDPAALTRAQEKTGTRGFASLTELLASVKADCIVLTTPSGLHSRQAAEAARAGFDVMTEKPMATRWSDGQTMVRACDEAGVRLFVVKQNRRNRARNCSSWRPTGAVSAASRWSMSMCCRRTHSRTTTARRRATTEDSTLETS